MKLSTVLLVVGLIILVASVVFFAAAPLFLVTVKPVEVWEAKSGDIYKERVFRVAGWEMDYWIAPYVGPFVGKDSKDFVVKGTVEEIRGRAFNFYIFSPSYYELWKAKLPYKTYVEVKGVTRHSFEFRPSKDDYHTLRFVVENQYPAPPILMPEDLVFRLSATWSGKRKA